MANIDTILAFLCVAVAGALLRDKQLPFKLWRALVSRFSALEPDDLYVSEIYVYPIKSCYPCSVSEATIDERGFKHDRVFMLVTQKEGQEGSSTPEWTNHHIKSHPINALVRPTVEQDQMIVTCPFLDQPYTCPLAPDTTGMSKIDIVMHKSKTTPWAYDVGIQAEQWFTKACRVPTKLVYLPAESHRPVLGNASGGFKQSKGITFSDCASYLVATTPSLKAVKQMLENPQWDIKPLRPNIVIDSKENKLEAWDEDFWGRLMVGDALFETTANCARCSSIDIDYKTGIRDYSAPGKKPLKEMAKTRRVDTGMKYSPVFGRYAFSADVGQTVRAGAPVKVAKRNTERTVFRWPGLSTPLGK